MAERRHTQLWITSTANAEATALVPAFRQRAISGQPGVMLAEWSAPDGADMSDPAVWHAAQAFWHDGRRRVCEKLQHTSGFRFDMLNMWGDDPGASLLWLPGFADYASPVMPWQWTAAGVESMPGSSLVSVALAGWVGERLCVSVARMTLLDAARACVGLPTAVGRSLATDPAWGLAGVPVEPKVGSGADVAAQFERLMTSGAVLHDGGELLSDQVRLCQLRRTSAGTVRLISTGDIDAIKAATWAADSARTVFPPPAIY
jgi:hypothetical protein